MSINIGSPVFTDEIWNWFQEAPVRRLIQVFSILAFTAMGIWYLSYLNASKKIDRTYELILVDLQNREIGTLVIVYPAWVYPAEEHEEMEISFVPGLIEDWETSFTLDITSQDRACAKLIDFEPIQLQISPSGRIESKPFVISTGNIPSNINSCKLLMSLQHGPDVITKYPLSMDVNHQTTADPIFGLVVSGVVAFLSFVGNQLWSWFTGLFRKE